MKIIAFLDVTPCSLLEVYVWEEHATCAFQDRWVAQGRGPGCCEHSNGPWSSLKDEKLFVVFSRKITLHEFT
jgi:hypothetical protein